MGRKHHGALLWHRGAKFDSPDRWVQAVLNPRLMEACALWSDSGGFEAVVRMATGVFEGTVVRTLRRTGHLLREVCSAAKVFGCDSMVFNEAEELICRGLVVKATDSPSIDSQSEDELEHKWPGAPISAGKVVMMHPMEIGFSHSHCTERFRNGNLVIDTLQRLLEGTVKIEDFSCEGESRTS